MPLAVAVPSATPLQLALSILMEAINNVSGSSTNTVIVVSQRNKSVTVTK